MQSSLPVDRLDPRARAFTLVEVLVVIAIMSVLMTAGAIGLGSMTGKGVTSGVASAESLFAEARGIALGKGVRACVLVRKEWPAAAPGDPRNADDLRRILVASEQIETNTGLAKWEIQSRGTTLPDQVFFSDVYSKKNHGTGADKVPTVTSSDFSVTKSSLEGEYYIYIFNSQGICETPGASFVVGAGARNGTKKASIDPPKVTSAGVRDFGGFVIWRNGNTSVFRSPDQIDSNIAKASAGSPF